MLRLGPSCFLMKCMISVLGSKSISRRMGNPKHEALDSLNFSCNLIMTEPSLHQYMLCESEPAAPIYTHIHMFPQQRTHVISTCCHIHVQTSKRGLIQTLAHSNCTNTHSSNIYTLLKVCYFKLLYPQA